MLRHAIVCQHGPSNCFLSRLPVSACLQHQVAIPLPKPILPLQLLDEYKLQLSFDGDRQLTPWLTIMGKGAPSVPVVEVVLRSSGSELLGVTASVATAPVAYQHKHMQLVQEFRNASHWPKHLLVRYHFETHNEVDLNRGLAVLFIAGLFSFLILSVTAVAGSSDKVAAFLAEVTAEDSMAVGRSSARGSMAKAE
ncbi:hypothetical protein QJQ45_005347 [Haematococcus lacustris]|nr:hypothetical protein QJQ45_005347 [Haematococcus lacustris]